MTKTAFVALFIGCSFTNYYRSDLSFTSKLKSPELRCQVGGNPCGCFRLTFSISIAGVFLNSSKGNGDVSEQLKRVVVCCYYYFAYC